MNNNIKAHWSFWIITSLLLVWNFLGCINFLAQMNADIVMQMPESHRAIIEGRVWWVSLGFAVAVFGGTIACFLLLFKKAMAQYFFIASLVGVFIELIPTLSLVGIVIVNPSDVLMMIFLPPVISIFLLIYSKYCSRKGWIT